MEVEVQAELVLMPRVLDVAFFTLWLHIPLIPTRRVFGARLEMPRVDLTPIFSHAAREAFHVSSMIGRTLPNVLRESPVESSDDI